MGRLTCLAMCFLQLSTCEGGFRALNRAHGKEFAFKDCLNRRDVTKRPEIFSPLVPKHPPSRSKHSYSFESHPPPAVVSSQISFHVQRLDSSLSRVLAVN